MGTLVYGTYEEIEEWCEENDMFVDKYLDHVNPSTVYNIGEWVGTGISDPFSVSVPSIIERIERWVLLTPVALIWRNGSVRTFSKLFKHP